MGSKKGPQLPLLKLPLDNGDPDPRSTFLSHQRLTRQLVSWSWGRIYGDIGANREHTLV
jgi:hypothetical protein